jgi:ferrous iron transport protein A
MFQFEICSLASSHVTKLGDESTLLNRSEELQSQMELKMIFNFADIGIAALADLEEGQCAVLEQLDLAPRVADHLMNLGFIPGVEIVAARSGPGGDPRVYRVDGIEVALRRDVSSRIVVRALSRSVR